MSADPGASVAEEWVQIARKDWARAQRNLRDRDTEAAGFFLQQSLEKYLKAFLMNHNWKLRKIHELDALLDEAARYQPELENFRDLCERVSGYYLAERYPPLSALELSSADIRRDLKEAREFVKLMFPKERLPRLKR
ncbi:MAG: HEPN domain-containing protein [Deltaproteobacteria bacterium]|nr:HEPN domain-containing protein [Deltaproteobacteria bacterium]